MVHEQLARLHFVLAHFDLKGSSVLDVGCGTGYTCDYLHRHSSPSALVGLDVSPEAVAFAQRRYPGLHFLVADATQPDLDLGLRFDYVLCFEVLEHVAQQGILVANLARHLKPQGVCVLSTPNRLVFSLGESRSFLNPTHVRELTLPELEHLLAPYFRRVDISGQRHRSPDLEREFMRYLKAHQTKVRWARRWHCQKWLSRMAWWMGRAGVLWLRLSACPSVWQRRWEDFLFSAQDPETAVWLVAVCREPLEETPGATFPEDPGAAI